LRQDLRVRSSHLGCAILLLKVSRQRARSEETPFAFIGRNFRDFRKKKKWTQAEFGQRLTRRKLSRQAIIWIESGRNTDLETIADIAATLGVAMEVLTQPRTSDERAAISPVIKPEPAKQAELVEELLAAEPSTWIDVVSRDERYQSPQTLSAILDRPRLTGGRKRRPRSPAKTPSVDQTPPAARDLVDQLLSRPASTWKDVVSNDSRYCSDEVLKELLDQATAVFYNVPRRSQEISFIAARLADVIHDAGQLINPELRVQAWKDLAYGTSRIGSHDDALRYLEIADAAADACADPVHQGAIVEFVRSIVLTNMEEYAEAKKRLSAAREVLEKVDRRRYLLTFHHEALIETVTGDPRKAAEIIDRVIREISTYGDEAEMAQLYTVASYAKLKSGEPQLALEYLRKSQEISTRKGDLSEIARNLWREAAAIATLGDYETAFAKFDEGREKLMALGLREDLISLNLDCLREKAAAGAEPQELHALCSQIAGDASAAGLPVTACEAIDWLRRIAERLTVDDVDRVSSFVKVSQLHPARSFEPPSN
jgi:transcriptional regulator with XRE-family HTH domain